MSSLSQRGRYKKKHRLYHRGYDKKLVKKDSNCQSMRMVKKSKMMASCSLWRKSWVNAARKKE